MFFVSEYFRSCAPELLPKLLSCVEWTERREAARAALALTAWPPLRVEAALELLDYAYADAAVRSFAVNCLAKIRCAQLEVQFNIEKYMSYLV